MITILNSFDNFLDMISLSRSENTAIAYAKSIAIFNSVLTNIGIDSNTTSIKDINEDLVIEFSTHLKKFSPATEQLYLIAIKRFYQYLVAEELTTINLQRLQMIIQARSRRQGQRLPQFPKSDLEKVIEYAKEIPQNPSKNNRDELINYRDSAFILTLADTGMRVHEACNIRRGNIDWNEYKAQIIGKGDHQAIVRFSSRSIQQIKKYLKLRAKLDGSSGKSLTTLPLFSRHDKGVGKKIKPISTTTGRNIVKQRTREILGENASLSISPHSFRHYFVTNVLIGSGGNLKLAQELARHKNIQVTQRYAHLSDDELDRGYHEIFDKK